ncbi:MAG: DUF6644 family protein [Alphaproteobacteria bacterium]
MDRIAHFAHDIGVWQIMNTDWGWPIAEILHYFGLSLLFGSVGLYDLRVLGVARGIPVGAIGKLIPFGVFGFCVNLITGVMFYLSAPGNYTYSPAFHVKVICMFIAGVNVLVFYNTALAKRTNAVGAGENAPWSSKAVALISFTAWCGVLAGGRFLGFFKPPQHWCEWCGLFS